MDSVRVYVSMSDKVVDLVMRRRGSRGLGWLKQPPTVEQCETIRPYPEAHKVSRK